MHATLAPARGTVGRVARAEGRFEAVGWRVRKDGSRFRASVVIDPVLEDGELVGYAKVTRDISERYEAEQELEQARKALLEAQKMESIGKLTLGLAHDFNNLNTIMVNSLELIGARHAGDQRTGDLVDTAMAAAERASLLTRPVPGVRGRGAAGSRGAQPGGQQLRCNAAGRAHRHPHRDGTRRQSVRARQPGARLREGGRGRMLVEDEAPLLMLVGDALEDMGYEVTRMASGAKALQDGGAPDVLVSDISMPEGVSGIDIAERALASGPSTRVILVSGLSRAQLPPLPEDAVFLPKPYRISQLMELLQ
ncbi:response regulator [Luteimonas sp. JM171]|uniref:response regulator n=1 Tax=Luteimonas sp. JM171 TaxID=1896164 RepID=UPI00085776D7|nr:hypothetical protein BGP89_13625 [Luteimonas sp. JM171]